MFFIHIQVSSYDTWESKQYDIYDISKSKSSGWYGCGMVINNGDISGFVSPIKMHCMALIFVHN